MQQAFSYPLLPPYLSNTLIKGERVHRNSSYKGNVGEVGRLTGAAWAIVIVSIPPTSMTSYAVIPSTVVDRMTNRYPRLDWPIDRIAVGEAFIVPLLDGADPDGRPEAHLRVLANKAGNRLRRKFSCRKTGDGLAISRIA